MVGNLPGPLGPLCQKREQAPTTEMHPDGPFGRPGARRAAAPCKRWCFAVLNSRHRSCVHPRPESPFWDPPEMSAYDWDGQKGLRPRCKGPYMLVFCFVGRTRDDGPVPGGQNHHPPVQNPLYEGLKKCLIVISRRSARCTLYAGIAIRLCFA
mgnify:CR=1 FL=1